MSDKRHKYALVAVWGFALVVGAASLSATGDSGSSTTKMMAIGGGQLCVTEGAVKRGRGVEFSIDMPKTRAFVAAETAQTVEAHFTYLGETAQTAALGSGAIRQQFGLKLRAQDACNLVYAMWRFSPKNEVVVSVKSNPGMHESSECGNKGYTNIKASFHSAVPEVTKGSRHVLYAEMDGQRMTVSADGRVVWEGSVGAGAVTLDGPVGIRSDNVRIELELFAAQAGGGRAGTIPACKAYTE